MIDWSELTSFLYILARISGFVLFNPLLGRRNIPGPFRSGMILVFTVFVAATSWQTAPIPVGTIDLAVHIFMELALGFVLGMVVNIFFYIVQMAGSSIDMQMGMTMNQIYDPASQANMSVTGVLLNVLMTLLFFVGNGHLTLIRIFLTSGDIVPFGAVSLGTDVYRAVLELFVECTVMGIKLCMPVLAAELVAQLGMGILMKVIPQINVFSINIQLKIIIGLLLLLLLIAPFSEFLLEAEVYMLNQLSTILGMVGS